MTGCYAVINGRGSFQYAIANGGNLKACYWQSSFEGFNPDEGEGVTKVDGTTTTWTAAMSAMNTAITDTGYKFQPNSDEATKATIPLVIVPSSI